MSHNYAADVRRANERLAAAPSATLDTPWGTVRYVDQGEGLPILLSHGVLGGHDSVRGLVDLWIGTDNRAIGPARFGYLGSTLPTGATPADQADAYAALLDHLEIERVVAVGVSAGGPSAIQFALRHSRRVHGLILLSAYLPGMARPLPAALHPLVRIAVGWERIWWLLKVSKPTLLARIMGVPKGWDASNDADYLTARETHSVVHRGIRSGACGAPASPALAV